MAIFGWLVLQVFAGVALGWVCLALFVKQKMNSVWNNESTFIAVCIVLMLLLNYGVWLKAPFTIIATG